MKYGWVGLTFYYVVYEHDLRVRRIDISSTLEIKMKNSNGSMFFNNVIKLRLFCFKYVTSSGENHMLHL